MPLGDEPLNQPTLEKPGMAGTSPNQDIFDVRKIRRLVELMKEHDLGEMDIRQGDTRIQLRRSGTVVQANTVPAMPYAAPAAAAADPVRQPPPAAPAPAETEHFAVIKSPMVGTFYSASDPDSPPYAKVGDHVGPETTVCIVEAMKVFNQIPAEISGKIVSVLAENGEPVEFGQPLFKVDTGA
jgi:acetyl-CoA carboxylase biotin carboxyl carrier protein